MDDTKPELETKASVESEKYIEESVAGKEETLWMSFVDYTKPAGKRFLGVIIINCLGPMHAMRETHRLGINPGGEIQFTQIESHKFVKEDFNVLLSEQDLFDRGYVDD